MTVCRTGWWAFSSTDLPVDGGYQSMGREGVAETVTFSGTD